MAVRNQYQTSDRLLPVEEAKPILESVLGPGWSRSSLWRKINGGYPFTWKEGLHYIRIGSTVRTLNVDAIIRELVR